MKQLTNITEHIVRQYVDKHIAGADVCGCEDCRMDIMAIMLNKLPPQYVVTDTGSLFAKSKQLDAQYAVNAAIALAEALEMVNNKPRHQ